ncbi:MAG: MFS transporter [Actinobacteria bacterium]|nr:MFS transporter [Actinomycetota bacterium]
MKALVARPDFRRLIVGQTASAFGDWLATVAFMALVLDLTESSTAVAGILVLRLAPTMVAGPVATRLVQRLDRRRLMLAMDLARAGVITVVPFVDALWWVYLWAFVLEVASLVFLPARDASIPDLVDGSSEGLELANGLVLASSYVTIPLGAGAFGAVSALAPSGTGVAAIGPAFFFDAFTFLVSFEMIRRITSIRSQAVTDAATSEGSFGDAFRIPLVRAVLPATAAAALGIGALFSLGIVFIRDVLGASNTQFGLLVALFGVGAGAGIGLLRWTGARGMIAIRFAVLVQGSVISLMSLSPNLALTFLGAVAFGGGAAASLAAGMSFLQSRLDGQALVLAFTGFHVVIRAALALAAVGAGIAADLLSDVQWPGFGRLEPARLVLFFSGIVVVIGAALARPGLARAEMEAT